MVLLGVDPHKDTHTVVAVDEAGRQLDQMTVPARTLSMASWSVGPGCAGRSASGRWRTAGTCLAGWNATCWPPGSGWCGVPPRLMA
jgi:transposase